MLISIFTLINNILIHFLKVRGPQTLLITSREPETQNVWEVRYREVTHIWIIFYFIRNYNL
jgi:hypothetical protein